MGNEKLKKSAERVQKVLESYGYDLVVKELSASTRTAKEAAQALECSVAQIAKSLIFRGAHSGRPILVVASGVNRVDEKMVGDIIGEGLLKADADFVFEQTGYKIGGVPPVGHKNEPITLIDEDILKLEIIWAAAGTPHAVFKMKPDVLTAITKGKVVRIH